MFPLRDRREMKKVFIAALINRISALTKSFSVKKLHKIISNLLMAALMILPVAAAAVAQNGGNPFSKKG